MRQRNRIVNSELLLRGWIKRHTTNGRQSTHLLLLRLLIHLLMQINICKIRHVNRMHWILNRKRWKGKRLKSFPPRPQLKAPLLLPSYLRLLKVKISFWKWIWLLVRVCKIHNFSFSPSSSSSNLQTNTIDWNDSSADTKALLQRALDWRWRFQPILLVSRWTRKKDLCAEAERD